MNINGNALLTAWFLLSGALWFTVELLSGLR